MPSLAPYRTAIDQLCTVHRVRRLDLFGSARGQELPPAGSDIDFLVEFETLPPSEYTEHYFGLREDLVALLGRSIDLVVERAIKNPYFLSALQASRESLFAA